MTGNTGAAIGLIGAAGLAALFLPSLADAHEAPPSSPVMAGHLRRGSLLGAALVGSLAVLYAHQAGSGVPLLIGAGVLLLVVGVYYGALGHDPDRRNA